MNNSSNNKDNKMTPELICTHLSDNYNQHFGAVVMPIYQNSLHIVPKQLDENKEEPMQYIYGRVSNPTVHVLEEKLAALEHGEMAVCFGSGMAAIAAALMHFLKAGDHVISVRSIYYPTKLFLEQYLADYDIHLTYVTGDDIDEIRKAVLPNTKLIYLESPSTAVFILQDLRAIADFARECGINTIIDNSWASPIFQNPLDFGIDITVHSMSKYIGGHSDIIAGVAIGSAEIMSSIANNERQMYGAILHPMEGWLGLRGLRTLPLRMKQHYKNAMRVAEFLQKHSKVDRVYYPGLPSHPQYELGEKQMNGYSGLLSFSIDSDNIGRKKLINSLKIFKQGCSWGGYESLVSQLGIDNLIKNFGFSKSVIRLSVGLEDCDSLIIDLDQALFEVDK